MLPQSRMSKRALITNSSIRYCDAHEQLIHWADATLHEQTAGIYVYEGIIGST